MCPVELVAVAVDVRNGIDRLFGHERTQPLLGDSCPQQVVVAVAAGLRVRHPPVGSCAEYLDLLVDEPLGNGNGAQQSGKRGGAQQVALKAAFRTQPDLLELGRSFWNGQ